MSDQHELLTHINALKNNLQRQETILHDTSEMATYAIQTLTRIAKMDCASPVNEAGTALRHMGCFVTPNP